LQPYQPNFCHQAKEIYTRILEVKRMDTTKMSLAIEELEKVDANWNWTDFWVGVGIGAGAAGAVAGSYAAVVAAGAT
jgi:pantoate kinase